MRKEAEAVDEEAQHPTPARMQAAGRWHRHQETLRDAIRLRLLRHAPPAVAAHARLIALDTIGCALAGRGTPELIALEREASTLEPGTFRLGSGPGIGMRPAVQMLAIAPTWHEACEGHAFAHGRPGIATLAAVLPLALAHDVSLDAFIDAFALGYEVGARAGGWLRVNPGLHVDGNWPALGAAAAAAALVQLGEEATVRAVDIAACQLPSSLYLPIRTGRNVRNLYLSHSATLGLDAALAAKAGFDAPPDALAHYAEHHCRASTQPMPAAAVNLLPDAYLKPFASVRHVHYGAIAARRIRHRLGGDAGGIRRIVLSIYEEATVYCNNPRPSTLLASQFSLTFGIAAMLAHGALDAGTYGPLNFNDAVLRRLEALVEVQIDADLTRRDRRGARLRVEFDQLDTLVETVADDDPDLHLTANGAAEKFLRNAAAAGVAAHDATAFLDAMIGGDGSMPLHDLWDLLQAGAHAGPSGS